jgi:hypothetical protein
MKDFKPIVFEAAAMGATAVRRNQRKVDIAERLGKSLSTMEDKKTAVVATKAAAATSVIEEKAPLKKNGKPMYMMKKVVSAAQIHKELRKKGPDAMNAYIVAQNLKEETEIPLKTVVGNKQKAQEGSGDGWQLGPWNILKPIVLALGAGVAVEGLVFAVRESRETPTPGKIALLYRYAWELRYSSFVKWVKSLA